MPCLSWPRVHVLLPFSLLLLLACQPPPTPVCTTDGDCTEATKPMCKDGVCQPRLPECATSADCKETTKPVCLQGTCQISSPPVCTTDSHCTEATKPMCKDGICQPRPLECTQDQDCKDAAKPLCKNGLCQPRPPECIQDQDCTEATKPVCLQGTCQPRPPECTQNSDCKNVWWPLCKNGVCQPRPPECTQDQDCKDTAKPLCKGGTCQPRPPECSIDFDCKDPARSACLSGVCHVHPKVPCQREEDCKDPARPACLDKFCQAPCPSDAACPSSLPLCLGGRCYARPPECTQDPDCKDPARPVCKDERCQAPGAECTQDNDCKVVERPLCQQGLCHARTSGCFRDTDCKDAAFPRCRQGVCGPLCRSNADCTAPSAVCQQGQCSLCDDDLDCPSALFCHRGQCVATLPTTCTKDADCKAPGQLTAKCTQGRCLRLRHVHFLPLTSGHNSPTPQGLAGRDAQIHSNSSEEQIIVGNHDWWDWTDFGAPSMTSCSVHRLDHQQKTLWSQDLLYSVYLWTTGFRCGGYLLENGDAVLLAKGGMNGFEDSATPYERNDIAIRRVDRQGKPLWTRFLRWQASPTNELGGPTWTDRVFWGVLPDESVILVGGRGFLDGYFRGTPYYFEVGNLRLPPSQKGKPFAVRFTPLGEIAWFRYLPLSVDGFDVDRQGNLYLGGSFSTETWNGLRLPNQGGKDLYVAKLDGNGGLVWLTTAGTSAEDCLLLRPSNQYPTEYFVVDQKGRVALAAGFNSIEDSCFRPNPANLPPPKTAGIVFGGQKQPHVASEEIFGMLTQISSKGQWDWANRMKGLRWSSDFFGIFPSKGGSWFAKFDDGSKKEIQEISVRGEKRWGTPDVKEEKQEKGGWLVFEEWYSCATANPSVFEWNGLFFSPPTNTCHFGVGLFSLDGFSGNVP